MIGIIKGGILSFCKSCPKPKLRRCTVWQRLRIAHLITLGMIETARQRQLASGLYVPSMQLQTSAPDALASSTSEREPDMAEPTPKQQYDARQELRRQADQLSESDIKEALMFELWERFVGAAERIASALEKRA